MQSSAKVFTKQQYNDHKSMLKSSHKTYFSFSPFSDSRRNDDQAAVMKQKLCSKATMLCVLGNIAFCIRQQYQSWCILHNVLRLMFLPNTSANKSFSTTCRCSQVNVPLVNCSVAEQRFLSYPCCPACLPLSFADKEITWIHEAYVISSHLWIVSGLVGWE